MVRLGVLLSGCGNLDGSDPLHVAAAIWCTGQRRGEIVAFAPEGPSQIALDHRTGQALAGSRDALPEAARLVRGACHPISAITVDHLDALFVPGGLGAVKTLCDLATRGGDAVVEEQTAKLLHQMEQGNKPLGAVAEGTLLLGATFRERSLVLAVGPDALSNQAVAALGHTPMRMEAQQPVISPGARIATAVEPGGLSMFEGMQAAMGVVEQLLDWAGAPKAASPGEEEGPAGVAAR